MSRATSVYKTLRFIVECRQPGEDAFAPIAAFDSEVTAIGYAMQSLKLQFEIFSTDNEANPENHGKLIAFGWRYRVVERRNNEPKCIYRSDVCERETKTVGMVFCAKCPDQNTCIVDRRCILRGNPFAMVAA